MRSAPGENDFECQHNEGHINSDHFTSYIFTLDDTDVFAYSKRKPERAGRAKKREEPTRRKSREKKSRLTLVY